MKSGLSSREIVLLLRRSVTVAQIFLQKCDLHRAPLQLNQMLAIIGAKPDRFVLQIVGGADEAHGPALCAH
jgi:hypothetical protein